jgi:Protein of unknown function (DUF2786)
MQCGRCHSEMVPSIQPGLHLIWVCTWRGCSKGAMQRPGRYEQASRDLKREQARTKIQRLLAVATSTIFPGEAESARALATGLAAKHCLNV